MSNFKMILAMIVFGGIAIFVHEIALPAAVIACIRAIVGMAILAVFLGFCKKRSGFVAFKKNAVALILSGIALSFNWIFLLEAHQNATAPVATVCYSVAPVLVLMISPIFLRERISVVSAACTFGALAGAILLTGILNVGKVNMLGAIYAFVGAGCYCAVIILNKKIGNISSIDSAFYQMTVASVVSVAYSVLTVDIKTAVFSFNTVWMLLVLGIATAIAYALMFSAAKKMSAQNWGVLSYIELAMVVVISNVLFGQKFTPVEILGIAMIVGFAIVNCAVKRKR